jgi:iron complex transport system ATP-binding protein
VLDVACAARPSRPGATGRIAVEPRAWSPSYIGPNARGKSTLLRGLARVLKPTSGGVPLDGEELARLGSKEVARRMGLLPRAPVAPEGLTVADLVGRGRFPHQRWFRQCSADDEAAIGEAVRLTGTADLADRVVDELSGGQRQRVWIAMTLAQDTPLLRLDEPTTYLDLAHRLEVLELLAELNETRGRTVVMVLHELNEACRYAHHLIAMVDGRIVELEAILLAKGFDHDVVDESP